MFIKLNEHNEINWWVMLKNYCYEMVGLSRVLANMTDFDRLKLLDTKKLRNDLKIRKRLFNKLNVLLQNMGMDVSLTMLKNVENDLAIVWLNDDQTAPNNPKYSAYLEIVNKDIDSLFDCINAELESRMFYYIPSDLVSYYSDSKFDKEVIEKFPDALNDMEEAGKCFAFSRPTACAFHLLRVIEHGIVLIEKQYSFQGGGSWGKFLEHLRKYAIDNPDRKKEIMVLHTRIAGIKDAWRDDTMHVTRLYSKGQAEEIYQVAINFMKELIIPLP